MAEDDVHFGSADAEDGGLGVFEESAVDALGDVAELRAFPNGAGEGEGGAGLTVEAGEAQAVVARRPEQKTVPGDDHLFLARGFQGGR